MRIKDGRALPNFFAQAIQGQDITIYGDGTQTRSFIYIDDMVEGIYKLLFSDYHLPMNIGNPQEISIVDLAKEILEVVKDSKSKLVFQELPVDDPKVRQPDTTKAKTILNWQPKISRKEGLQRTFKYFKAIIK
jgi:dTDP-glucose 4,6-dehydratase